jgi:hypothetical protein
MSGFGGLRPLIPAHQALEPVQTVVAPVLEPMEPSVLPPPPERLQVALRALRWTYGTLAVELRTSPSTTRNWGLGRSPVPPALLAWLEDLAAYHVAHPPERG